MSDLVYTSLANCPTSNWFWITWEPTGQVTLGQGQISRSNIIGVGFVVLGQGQTVTLGQGQMSRSNISDVRLVVLGQGQTVTMGQGQTLVMLDL